MHMHWLRTPFRRQKLQVFVDLYFIQEVCSDLACLVPGCSCFASPHKRARQTAEVLWEGQQGPLTYLDGLREANLGWFQGLRNGGWQGKLWWQECVYASLCPCLEMSTRLTSTVIFTCDLTVPCFCMLQRTLQGIIQSSTSAYVTVKQGLCQPHVSHMQFTACLQWYGVAVWHQIQVAMKLAMKHACADAFLVMQSVTAGVCKVFLFAHVITVPAVEYRVWRDEPERFCLDDHYPVLDAFRQARSAWEGRMIGLGVCQSRCYVFYVLSTFSGTNFGTVLAHLYLVTYVAGSVNIWLESVRFQYCWSLSSNAQPATHRQGLTARPVFLCEHCALSMQCVYKQTGNANVVLSKVSQSCWLCTALLQRCLRRLVHTTWL